MDMTVIYLPKPYPDELLYSVIARYLSRTGGRGSANVVATLFGVMRCGSIETPIRLNRLASKLGPNWNPSADEILTSCTLFPYHTVYMPEARRLKCADGFKADGKSAHSARVSMGSTRQLVQRSEFLRFCPDCRREDIESLGETYWRRSHQIAGLLVCSKHGGELVESAVVSKVKFRFGDANHEQACEVSRRRLLTPDERKNALRLAVRCTEFLAGKTETWRPDGVRGAYREAALSRGYVRGSDRCDSARLEAAVISFYGKEFLELMGASYRGLRPTDWIRRAFRMHTKNVSPMEHAMIQVFLESTEKTGTHRTAFGTGPWFCPNPYVKHDMPTIRQIELLKRGDREWVAVASCSCGFRFSFRRLEDNTSNVPFVDHRIWLTPEWRSEAVRLKNTGSGVRSIAAQMGLGKTRARQLLEGKFTQRASEDDVDRWKKEWESLLLKVPHGNRRVARKADSKLWWRLRRHAENEFFATWQRRPGSGRGGSVDRDQKDSEMLVKLQSAEARLRGNTNGPRRTRNSICIEARVDPSYLLKLDKFPRCAKFLEDVAESKAEYYERKLRRAVRLVNENGHPFSHRRILRVAGLGGRANQEKFAPLLEQILTESVSQGRRNADESRSLLAETLSQ
jgi:hypothetical protein